MTEAEWLTCIEPVRMLEWINGPTRRGMHDRPCYSERKLRLFVKACRVRASDKGVWDLDDAHGLYNALDDWMQEELDLTSPVTREWQCAVLRDIFGNPFRPMPVLHVRVGGNMGIPEPTPHPWLAWNDRTAPRLAQKIYDSRDFSAMPILADALEEAGCENQEILRHCRETENLCPVSYRHLPHDYCDGTPADSRPIRGLHVRGCWCLDLILGKS